MPQSSCSFSEVAPPSTISTSAPGSEALPFPAKARFIGNASAASIIRAICHGPGVQVVASVPCAGPVPPPSMQVNPLINASSICCGQMKWIWLSMPPAVTILPSPAIASVPGPTMIFTPGWVSGLPALPIATIRPSFKPISALTIPQWSTISALVMTVSTAPPSRVTWLWPMPSRMTLPPPNFTSSP
ncbi:hypothetical protein AB7M37_000857 [Sinorhizobium fredii]